MPLTLEQKKNRLLRAAKVADQKEVALFKEILALEEKVAELLKMKKGDKGDQGDAGYTPRKGVDYFDGEDYVLTTKDKKDIAKEIEVPIVEKVIEKTEVIKEQPIVTKEIKEVVSPEIEERLGDLESDLEELEKKSKQNINGGVRVIGGRAGISLYTNGTKRGIAQMVNLIPGIGVSLSYDYANGRNDITINASASTSVLTATGTINDSNVTFTFTSEPAILIINGASYQQTGGAITWTYSGGTVTLSSAVGSGGSIFGLA